MGEGTSERVQAEWEYEFGRDGGSVPEEDSGVHPAVAEVEHSFHPEELQVLGDPIFVRDGMMIWSDT